MIKIKELIVRMNIETMDYIELERNVIEGIKEIEK